MLTDNMKEFQFVMPDILFGNGTIAKIGERVKAIGGHKVLIFTDQGLTRAGVVGKVQALLEADGLACRTFDTVEAEPSLGNVNEGLAFAKEDIPEVLVGLGGGSSMDVAKMVAILLKHGGSVMDYLGIDNIPGRGLPTIMVTTTAGTGSEVSKYAIFDDREAKTKKGAVSFHLVADLALIDPELTLSVPRAITSSTGCDALIHAIEGYLATNASPITDLIALEAVKIIFKNLPAAFADGHDPLARYNMSYGSFLAGIVLNHAGGSSSHALSYPVASEYHTPHGVGCMLTFLEVLEYFAPCSIDKFVSMAEVMGIETAGVNPRIVSENVIFEIRKLVEYLGIPHKLSAIGVDRAKIEGYAKSVVENQQRLITNGPMQLNEKDIITIYERSF